MDLCNNVFVNFVTVCLSCGYTAVSVKLYPHSLVLDVVEALKSPECY